MNRSLSTNLPMTEELLKPQIPDFTTVKAKEEEQRRKQMKVFDSRHSAQELDPLLSGEQVWVEDHNTSGNVVEPVAPRSYRVSVPTGIIRRNCTHLRCIPNESETVVNPQSGKEHNTTMGTTVTKSGHISRPPTRWSPGEGT